MRCKLFRGENEYELEQNINIWLASNKEIKIDHILQSSYLYVTIISIWYSERK